MAVKPCRECGESVSMSAKACPHCGAPKPEAGKMGCGPAGCLWVIAAAVALGVIGSLTEDPEPGARAPAQGTQQEAPSTTTGEYADLEAVVRRSPTQLSVTNDSEQSWRGCEIEINPGIIRGGWKTGPVDIGPGETVAGGLMTFTKADGERFQPSRYEVESVTVVCESPKGLYSGSW